MSVIIINKNPVFNALFFKKMGEPKNGKMPTAPDIDPIRNKPGDAFDVRELFFGDGHIALCGYYPMVCLRKFYANL